jgi:hypothetical protein
MKSECISKYSNISIIKKIMMKSFFYIFFILISANHLKAENSDTIILNLYTDVSIKKIMVRYDQEVIKIDSSHQFRYQYKLPLKLEKLTPYNYLPLRIYKSKFSTFHKVKFRLIFIYYPQFKYIHLFLNFKRNEFSVYYLPMSDILIDPSVFFY